MNRPIKQKTGRIPFPHPGETIREDYLKPLGMSGNRLAIELRVPGDAPAEDRERPPGNHGRYCPTARRYCNTTPKFWLNLQSSYDLAIAAEAKEKEIARTVHPREAA